MKFDWNQEKNEWLKVKRNITFEEIICLIDTGYLKAVLMHPRKQGQKIFVVQREGYAYNVPFVEQEDETCFLKTIYPSRASTKKYIGDKHGKDIS
jgi:hypothetical protein